MAVSSRTSHSLPEAQRFASQTARDAHLFALSLLEVETVLGALPAPISCPISPTSTQDGALRSLQTAVDRLTNTLELPQLRLRPQNQCPTDIFSTLVGRRFGTWLSPVVAALVNASANNELRALALAARSASSACRFRRTDIVSAPSVALRTYRTGSASDHTVLIAMPCGMPVQLCERWFDTLSERRRVLSWETRGLFGGTGAEPLPDHDVESQARDLLATLDHEGVQKAHLMGICGGAVIALVAATLDPGRFDSMSLWYGDFEVGPHAPRTEHQDNLRALLDMAAEDRTSAAAVRQLVLDTAGAGAPNDIALALLYPFASDELMYRYSRLNGAIMSRNVYPLLALLPHRSLVVTGTGDNTAHPDGSRVVARGLSGAELHIQDGGDHLSMFRADDRSVTLLEKFLRAP